MEGVAALWLCVVVLQESHRSTSTAVKLLDCCKDRGSATSWCLAVVPCASIGSVGCKGCGEKVVSLSTASALSLQLDAQAPALHLGAQAPLSTKLNSLLLFSLERLKMVGGCLSFRI